MPDTIFSQIIPLTAAMALPFPVIKGTRLLLAGKPVVHSMIFIATWGIACFLALSAAVIWKALLLEIFGVFVNYTLPEKFSGWMHIILGFVFIGASCKTIFSLKLCVMLKILSSEYQLYACGKISRMP
ncbi:hypothetical protein ACFL0S_10675 [Thermodesulfobacteriota bacterium]